MGFRPVPDHTHTTATNNLGDQNVDDVLEALPSVSSPSLLSNSAAQGEVNDRLSAIERNLTELYNMIEGP